MWRAKTLTERMLAAFVGLLMGILCAALTTVIRAW